MTVRPRIQREFLSWFSTNHSRFAVPVHVHRRTDRWMDMSFDNVTPILSATLTRWEITVAVIWRGICWDLLLSLEVHLEARARYANRQTLWREELFEPFLEWVNLKLAQARLIGIYQLREGGATWAELHTKRLEQETGSNGIFVPVRIGQVTSDPH